MRKEIDQIKFVNENEFLYEISHSSWHDELSANLTILAWWGAHITIQKNKCELRHKNSECYTEY